MTIAPADVLAYVGGAAFARFGTLTRRTGIPTRGGEEGIEVFSRSSVGTYVDRTGVLRLAAAGVPRVTWRDLDGDGQREPYLLMEAARSQIASNPETPNSWTNILTPIITTGITSPFGSTSAILVQDDDEIQAEGKFTAIAATGDATKVFTVAIRAGTAATVGVGLWAANVTTWRHLVRVTWNGPAAPTLDSFVGSGMLFAPVAVLDSDGIVWWLVSFAADGVIATDTNQLWAMCGVVGSAIGTFYLAGANAWNATVPASWQGGSLGSRSADELDIPIHLPHAIDWTLLLRFAAPHAEVTTLVDPPDLLELSDEAGLYAADNRILVQRESTNLKYFVWWQTPIQGTAFQTFTATTAPQELVVRHRETDHALQLELDGSASSYGAAPTSHGLAQGVHRFLRLRNDGDWLLRALILARGSHAAAEFAEWLP